MIPEKIVTLMSKQTGKCLRPAGDKEKIIECLKELGIEDHEQIKEFFIMYKASAILSKTSNEELMDLLSPTKQIADVTEFVRDVYGVKDDYICISSAEGEGFFLYSKIDSAIYDVNVEELEELEAGSTTPKWTSFFDFLEWYLQ